MKTKIFFAASSDTLDRDKKLYKEIVSMLENSGFEISQVVFRKEEFDLPSGKVDYNHIYDKVIQEINKADILVADITYPSGGVGYQVYHAFYQKKPVIVLYTDNNKSNPSMVIRGIKSKNFFTLKYDQVENLKTDLLPLIRKAEKLLKVRFNLVLGNNDYAFIESAAKRLNVSKTEYLKKLIQSAHKKGKS